MADPIWLCGEAAGEIKAVMQEVLTGGLEQFMSIPDSGGRARAGLEPTGDYHRALAHRLAQAGVEVVSISSVAQSRYREAMFNSSDKNDPKDAGVILEMRKQGRTQQYVDPCSRVTTAFLELP